MPEVRFEKRRRRSRIALLAIALIVLGAAVAGAVDAPTVTGNVRVNDVQQLFPHDNPTRSTSTIASSLDGSRLLVGFEDLQGACGPPSGLACPPETPPGLSGYAFSTDGGTTWTDGGSLFAINHKTTAGHPWVDRLARVFELNGNGSAGIRRRDGDTYFYISRMEDETTGATDGGIGIYRGHFGAGTFVFDDGKIINSSNPEGDEYSRASVAAAKDGSLAAYVALVNVDEICGVPLGGFGQIEVWRTHDGGNSWQGPVVVGKESSLIVDANDPNCGNEGFLQIAPAVTIGRHGEVYVVWQYGPHFFPDGSNSATDAVRFAASFDGGKTFTAPKDLVTINAMRANPPVGYAKNRLNDQPRIAVALAGPDKGRVFVTYYQAVSPVLGPPAAQSLVSSQSYLTWSDDRGRTWSAPLALGAAVPATGLKRFWPTVSVRPNGDVDVVYLESQEVATGTPCSVQFNPTTNRTGPASSLVDTFWVQSRNGGRTFSSPLKVSTETSNWCTAPYTFDSALPSDGFLLSNAGDYIGSTSVDDSTFVVWPDDRNGPMDTFFAEISGETGHHRPRDLTPQ